MAWAMPSQAAATARHRALPTRKIGPGPLRTARGAGRRAAPFFFAVLFLGAGLRLEPDPDERLREAEPLFPDERVEVPLLRDAGGEDVRVAMLANLPRTPHLPLASHARAEESRRTGAGYREWVERVREAQERS